MQVASEQDLFKACRTLFDIESDISRDFLEYLQMSGIKTAYRKKAFETHPDRAAFHGNNIADHDKLFQSVHQAYVHLTAYLKARDEGFRFSDARTLRPRKFAEETSPPQNNNDNLSAFYASAGRAGTKRQSIIPETEKYYTGNMPNRRLLFGHFLYYTGHINWRHIIQALIWQRSQRPRLGELAARFGWLTKKDILTISQNRTFSQPFGLTALRLGLLNENQLNMLLFQQNRLQKKIGSYFVETDILTRKQLNKLVLNQQEHNARFARISGKSFSRF